MLCMKEKLFFCGYSLVDIEVICMRWGGNIDYVVYWVYDCLFCDVFILCIFWLKNLLDFSIVIIY